MSCTCLWMHADNLYTNSRSTLRKRSAAANHWEATLDKNNYGGSGQQGCNMSCFSPRPSGLHSRSSHSPLGITVATLTLLLRSLTKPKVPPWMRSRLVVFSDSSSPSTPSCSSTTSMGCYC